MWVQVSFTCTYLFQRGITMYDPKAAAQKQIRRAQEASQDYVSGVQNTTINPMQRAKAKKDKFKINVMKAIDDGSWEAGLDAVSMEEWKAKTAGKGGDRYAAGVADAASDIEAFHAEFAPVVARVKAEVDAMPDTTLEQRLARMTANAKGLARFSRTKRRR